MSIWSKIIESVSGNVSASFNEEVSRDASNYAIVDCEVGMKDQRVHDSGALRWDGVTFHSADKHAMKRFLDRVNYVCGHNIIHHDAKYLFREDSQRWALVDTLYVSPLLFPERPYHRLLKDDKLVSEQMNNPVNDCIKARDLFYDEVAAWKGLPLAKQKIYRFLLKDTAPFRGFFTWIDTQNIPKETIQPYSFSEVASLIK